MYVHDFCIYALADYDGETIEYEAECYNYYEDGTYDWTELDENGNEIKSVYYDAAGNVIE